VWGEPPNPQNPNPQSPIPNIINKASIFSKISIDLKYIYINNYFNLKYPNLYVCINIINTNYHNEDFESVNVNGQ
jgi:hypothetical protein